MDNTPVRKHVVVQASAEQAFRTFTEGMATWWPLGTHSMATDEDQGVAAETVVVEPAQDGRIVERRSDGTEAEWGRFVEWEPPRRVVISWKPNRSPQPPTAFQVTFTPEGEGTRVELTHGGWDRLGADAEEARASYDTGWPGVLELFAAAASR